MERDSACSKVENEFLDRLSVPLTLSKLILKSIGQKIHHLINLKDQDLFLNLKDLFL
jgi:hypothetical protein